ncbi:MAG: UDP-3-O-acyl-N-acetylglucosamine deacetylase [Proteobacteria bacterium]|nr:UDP-3-O-acyl-N-acetylglucosamine deacetylase [Pseudomonadota bacterium]
MSAGVAKATWPPAERRLLRATPVFAGLGLHGAAPVRAWVEPARRPGAGILVRRLDRQPLRELPATFEHATPALAQTRLGSADHGVATIEHLLSALCGYGVWDAVICVDGPELPILDGSSSVWAAALVEACAPEPFPRAGLSWSVARPWQDQPGRSRLRLTPAPVGRICCELDHAHPAIGRQQAAWSVGDAAGYLAEIAAARTFGFAADAEALRQRGLARGAGLHCVLVFDERGILNPEGERLVGEPARHKLLDAIGDLGLLGGPLRGKVELSGSSHRHLLLGLRRAVAAGVLRRD